MEGLGLMAVFGFRVYGVVMGFLGFESLGIFGCFRVSDLRIGFQGLGF